jgi:hypothetical protein
LRISNPHDPEVQPVRKFVTFTEDLGRLADWLQVCCVTTVAMESTGVFWIPLMGFWSNGAETLWSRLAT